jgi:hypothetical protein
MQGDAIVRRPAYEMSLRSGLAEAANMLAAEAAAERRTIERPFNGLAMKAWPGITGAQVVVDWQYDLGCRRETKQRAERDALRARAEAAEQRAEAAEAALAAARAEVAQAEVARAGGKAKIRYLERELGRVETYWRKRLWGAQ